MKHSNFEVMEEQEFVDALYPWFEPRTAPKHLKRLKRIMQEPAVREKVLQEKISYLVWLDGEVDSQGATGAMTCGMGPDGDWLFWLHHLGQERRCSKPSSGTWWT